MMFLVFIIGLVTLGTSVDTVEAVQRRNPLDPIRAGRAFKSVTSPSQGWYTPTRYKHLLGANNSYNYLPDVSNLGRHGVANKGWGLNTPARNETGSEIGHGGREFSHSVYPSLTKFIEDDNGDVYLRIMGSTVIPSYFHHTDVNHQVAIVTKEGGRAGTIKSWRADLINQTSSATYDYGYGYVSSYPNESTDWRARVNQTGRSYPLHVTTDPYPKYARKVNRSSDNLYFNSGNRNLLNNKYDSWINERQVSNLAGLGKVGSRVTGSGGNTYVLDYTGFRVDIPVSLLISDSSKETDVYFNVVMTMSTPDGEEARIVGQTLGIPGMSTKGSAYIDTGKGQVGEVELHQSNRNAIRYNPYSILLRNFKKTSNFTTREYSTSTMNGTPSNRYFKRYNQFSASSDSPRMIGIGGDLLPRFDATARAHINSPEGRRSADFVEMRKNGRGEMWVGWNIPSIHSSQKIYTPTSNAYDDIPEAKMTYTPQKGTHKAIEIRHRLVRQNDTNSYRSPLQMIDRNVLSSKKGGSGVTARHLTSSELRSLGNNLQFTGAYRIGTDPTTDVRRTNGSIRLTNNQLFSSQYNGDDGLVIEMYYTGDPYVPKEDGQLVLRERHRPVGTSNNISGTAVDHRIGLGSTMTVTRQRPYGYTYAGYYKVNSGRNQRRTSYTVRNDRPNTNWSQWAIFYYNLRRYNYTVEHINAETGNKIEYDDSDYLTSTNPNRPSRRTVRPLRGNDLPGGYSYAGYYRVDGTRRNGNSYTIKYDDETNNLVVRFYYDWNEPEETTKRFQGDDTGSPRPVDTYINAGLQTERDVNGNVVGTTVQANTSAVIDSYEAPIAIVPQKTRIALQNDDENALMSSRVSSDAPVTVYNNEYLETLRLDRRIGGSREANGNQPTRVSVTGGIPMSTGTVSGTEDLQNKALGQSGATVGVNEDRDFVGRWVDSGVTDMRRWTPDGISGVLSRSVAYSNEDDINSITDVVATYDVDVYNRIKHNYQPRVGSDGLEYYEYTGSDILQGYYRYNSSGNRTGELRPARVSQITTLDIDDIGVNEYVDAEGFKVGAGQVAPSQFKVASELFSDEGMTLKGYQSEALPNDGAVDPVVSKEDTTYNVDTNADTPRVDYYEEFGYVPFHTEDEVTTQQAIPVGGKVTYVNPYEYFVFPTVDRLSVMEESGNTVNEIRNNVSSFNGSGFFDSDVAYTPEHSGFYMSEVDEVEEFESSIPEATDANKNHMETNVTPVNQYNPIRPDKLTTRNYKTYNSLIEGSTSRYTPVDTLQSVDNFNKKLPITYVYNLQEFILDDVVAVGQDTGYPVVGQADTIENDYVTRYTSDNGVAPSDTDKLVTSNNGSIYLIPTNNEGQSVDDVYNTRLYVNQIGISQFNLIDEDEITYDKYLYGRGDNVIYSGEREEVEVDGEFTQDQEVGHNAKPEKTTQVNGTRTSNNKEVNDKVLDDE